MTAPVPDITRQADHLAGLIVTEVYDDFWPATHRYEGAEYELVGADEYESDDPYLTVLRRKSDGQHFEIEIEVTARPCEPPVRFVDDPGEIVGQEALPIGGEPS